MDFLKYFVNTNGASCYDFLLQTDSSSVANTQDSTSIDKLLNLALDDLTLKSITCFYRDDKLKTAARIYIPEIKGAAKIDSLTTIIDANGSLKLTECKFDQSNLDKLQQADIQFDLQYGADTLVIEAMNLKTEGASLDASGKLTVGEVIGTDLSISASGLNLAELSKYIPSEKLDTFKINQISGVLDLQASVKGIVSDSVMPHYDAKFNLSNGAVKWQDYPMIKRHFDKRISHQWNPEQ